MKKKKLIILCILAALLLALITTAVILKIRHDEKMEQLRIYNATYLVVDGIEYRRDSTSLDLSNKQIGEFDKLKELTALRQLNLRSTGITAAQYDALRAALPGCSISWSVPFQGGFYDDDTQELTLTELSNSDVAMLSYLPALTSINADACRDYESLFMLMEQYPDITVTYTVPIGDLTVGHTEETITISDPDASELFARLPLLPALKTVTLEGAVPDNEIMLELKNTFPNIRFSWNFTVCGVEANSLDDYLDLSGIALGSTEELEAALPYFYELKKVDMVDCGFSNSEMDDLNWRHPKTRFIWEVPICGKTFRTDIRYFMPWQIRSGRTMANLQNLRYCKDIEVMDFGHMGVSDFSFVEDLPKLRCLLVLDCPITDLQSISTCTSLEFLEIAQTTVRDYWPLTNLSNLKDLNISSTPHNLSTHKTSGLNDISMLYQFTQLDRLWSVRSFVKKARFPEIHGWLPDSVVMLEVSACTSFGWRQSPLYYEHRDIMGMYYMMH